MHLLSSLKEDFLGSTSHIAGDINASVSVTKKAVSMIATAASGVPVNTNVEENKNVSSEDNEKFIEDKTN